MGWFQGGAELGPRALGARSILANPCSPNMKDHINSKVKHREMFRPFAASICEEDVGQFFESGEHSHFMSFAVKAKKEVIDKIPAVLHVDKTSRIQSVTEDGSPLYYQLIKTLKNYIGIPMVLNTSFNDNNEPIVETPADALRHLALGYVDLLVLENYIVTRV